MADPPPPTGRAFGVMFRMMLLTVLCYAMPGWMTRVCVSGASPHAQDTQKQLNRTRFFIKNIIPLSSVSLRVCLFFPLTDRASTISNNICPGTWSAGQEKDQSNTYAYKASNKSVDNNKNKKQKQQKQSVLASCPTHVP